MCGTAKVQEIVPELPVLPATGNNPILPVLVIHRSEWLRGTAGSALSRRRTQPGESTPRKCCVGIALRDAGVPVQAMEDITTVRSLKEGGHLDERGTRITEALFGTAYPDLSSLYNINDGMFDASRVGKWEDKYEGEGCSQVYLGKKWVPGTPEEVDAAREKYEQDRETKLIAGFRDSFGIAVRFVD